MNNEKWKQHYAQCNIHHTWIKVMTTDGEHFFFSDPKKWFGIKEYCEKKSVFIQDMHLQFRSHKCIMDIEDAEALYLVNSVLGVVGMDTKHYLTIGVLKDGMVHKKMWLVPELIVEKETTDDLSLCFREAIIYNEEKKKNQQE